jgi:sugar lactone lactonase YvrE
LSDSAGLAVDRFGYDPASGRTGLAQPWLRLTHSDGLPDGATFDRAGHYWQARNGAGFLAAHAPDGTLLRRLDLPTANVTSLAFGGPEMDALLVTSMNRCLPWQDRVDGNAGRCFLVTGSGLRGHIEPVTSFPF